VLINVGVLGGAFNPPHNAHLALARAALRECALERMVFVPSSSPPHKKIEGGLAFDERALLIGVASCCTALDDLMRGIQCYVTDENRADADALVARYQTAYAWSHDPRMSVSLVERNFSGPSYTIDMVRALLSENQEWNIHLVIGMDQAAVFEEWREWETLVNLVTLCVADRPGFDGNAVKARLPFARFFPFDPIGLSSSDVRGHISRGEAIDKMVPDHLCDLLHVMKPSFE
jgi:nicotinate-nucleotide adenylyltransferase